MTKKIKGPEDFNNLKTDEDIQNYANYIGNIKMKRRERKKKDQKWINAISIISFFFLTGGKF